MTVEQRKDFEAFYLAHHQRLVIALYAYVGDLAEAQDLTQEAFARALPRWERLSRYDAPLAWVRRVAWNLATSRWRRFRRLDLFVVRHRPEPVPYADRVDLHAPLSTLPARLRRALVMHYLADMSVLEIAAHELVPITTVRSWLRRGRDALAAALTDQRGKNLIPGEPDLGPVFDQFAAGAGKALPAPDLAGVRIQARRRGASRWAIAAAAITALAAPIAANALANRSAPPSTNPPANTSPPAAAPAGPATGATTLATAPMPSPAPAGLITGAATRVPVPINATDWVNATLKIPANRTGCAAGTAHFHNKVAEVGASRYRLGSGYLHSQTIEVAYGDVDADGQPEALLTISCATPDGRANPTSLVLLIAAAPSMHTMDLAFSTSPRASDGEGKSYVTGLTVHPDGRISFEVRTFEGNGQCVYQQKWTGSALWGGCNP